MRSRASGSRRDVDPAQPVHVQRHDRALPQAEDRGGAGERVVRRLRREQGEVGGDPVGPRVRCGGRPRGQQRGEVGQRSPVGEHAAARLAVPDLAEHPAQDLELDRRRRGAHLVDRHRVVGRAVDEVGERGGEVGRGDLMGQVGRVVQPGALGEIGAQELPVALRGHPALSHPPPEPEPLGQLPRGPAPDDGRQAPLALVHVGGQLVNGHTGSAYELFNVPHHTGILVDPMTNRQRRQTPLWPTGYRIA